MKQPEKTHLSDLDHELHRIEAEDKTLITIENKSKLLAEIKKIDELKWQPVDATNSVKYFPVTNPDPQLGYYEKDANNPRYEEKDDAMYTFLIFVVKRSLYDKKQAVAAIKNAFTVFDPTSSNTFLELYKQTLLTAPNNNGIAIDYFRYTGLVVSKNNIADTLTLERAQNIFSSLELDIRLTQKIHKDYL